MKKAPVISASLLVACGLLVASGCSSSSTPDPTAKIEGVSPGEYREKAELDAQAKAAQAKGKGARPRR